MSPCGLSCKLSIFTSVSYKLRPYLDTEGEGPGEGEEDQQRAQAGQHAGARPGPRGVSCKHPRMVSTLSHGQYSHTLIEVTLVCFLKTGKAN